MKTVLFAALLLSAGPAMAEPLWRNVEAGMTVAQLHALYPAEPKKVIHKGNRIEIKKAVQIGNCGTAEVEVWHRDGVVTHVSAYRNDLGLKLACVEEAYAMMIETYGKPDSEIENEGEGLSGIKYKVYTSTWLRPAITVTMDRKVGLDEFWRVTYKAKGATGSGL